MVAQAKIDAKHRNRVRSALRASSKPKTGAAQGAAGRCTITFGGGFTVCQDGVIESACTAVAGQMGGHGVFKAGAKCGE